MVVLVMREMCHTTRLRNPAVIATDVLNMNVTARNNHSSRTNLHRPHLRQETLHNLRCQSLWASTLVVSLVSILYSRILSKVLSRVHLRPQDHAWPWVVPLVQTRPLGLRQLHLVLPLDLQVIVAPTVRIEGLLD